MHETMTGGDTVWWLIAASLSTLTLPGIAFMYGGLVRRKNVVNTMGVCLAALALGTVDWLVPGELWPFGARISGAGIPDTGTPLRLLTLYGVGAALAVAILSGACVERLRWEFVMLFGMGWVLLVYRPVTGWFGPSGWLNRLGSLDYASGAAIHASAGVSALILAVMLGPRGGYGRTEMRPNHLPLSACGAALFWVGWMGFAGGREAAPMRTVVGAVVATQICASCAALTWLAVEWMQRDKPTMLGTVSGALAGLVGIAPAAGYVGPAGAIVIGVGAGGLCYMVVNYVRPILGYDDSMDVFGIHGIGATWGLVGAGLFASMGANPDGSDGLFYGYPYQLFAQLVAAGAVWLYAALGTALLCLGIRRFVNPRVAPVDETAGLDLSLHGERGYAG